MSDNPRVPTPESRGPEVPRIPLESRVPPKQDLSFILNHLGEDRENYRGAVSPPIFQSSIFAFPTVDAFRAGFRDEFRRTTYTRGNNPTVEILRKKIAALEGSEDCLMFGSGAGAVSAAIIASVAAGDHVICVARPYSWTRAVLRDLLGRFGVTTTFIDGTDVGNFERAITAQTKLIVLESPNSMTFEQQDLAAVARLARARGIRTLCDNSYATPLNQSPIALGIDMVAHSATKYLNGHSDVVAGALCASEAILREVFKGPYMTCGAILSPHDAWLMIRGLRTLSIRMERVARTTRDVLAYLHSHAKVEKVYYPHDESNPQFGLSQAQTRGASGLLTIQLRAPDIAAVERFCNALGRFLMTVSWGGYESLLFPVCAVYPADAALEPAGSLPLSLVRLSIGLEEADVLIADLEQAFAQV
jgi:cystathionine beta-lyase/cystathionine gamma-synthase